jgi:DNA-directed RNA polymerase subunit H (RpoH/RPB5)
LAAERGAKVLLSQVRLVEERLPSIDPEEPIESVWEAKMLDVLSDWRSVYITVGQSWLKQAANG